MLTEPLQEIPSERVSQFLETLKSCHPQSGSIEATIRKTVEAAKKDFSFQWKLLTTEDGEESGTCVFMILKDTGTNPIICLFARKGEETKLLNALRETSRIPWKKNPKIFRLDEKLLEPLRSALGPKIKVEVQVERVEMLWISSKKILSLENAPVPKGLSLRNLEETDVPVVAKPWIYVETDVVRSTLQQNRCCGLENQQGELAGWVLWGQCGGLAHLYVRPDYRRRGIGRYLVIRMSKILTENGYDPITANVACSNSASLALLRGVGFQHAFYDYYLKTVYTE